MAQDDALDSTGRNDRAAMISSTAIVFDKPRTLENAAEPVSKESLLLSQVTASREDVVECYRLILDRYPENDKVIEDHLADNPALWEIIRRFLESKEARAARPLNSRQRFHADDLPSSIEVETSQQDLDKLLECVRRTWDKLGAEDPYWSVLVEDKYRAGEMSAAQQEEFYSSGEQAVTSFLEFAGNAGLVPRLDGSVLDFGCGLGRLGEHFSKRFSRYIGVDVSSSHLDIAKNRFEFLARANTELVLLPTFLKSRDSYDVIYSIIVLQHNPPPVMLWLIKELLSRLKPGGIAYFQLPCHLFDYQFNVRDYFSNPLAGTTMEMHALPQQYVFRAIAEAGCRPVKVMPHDLIGPLGQSYVFLVTRTSAQGGQ
jgi:SAM-dependent methyltransferase